MADEAKLYRARAESERLTAATSDLPNVRDRSLYAAERWDELAERAERAAAGAATRSGRMTAGGIVLPRAKR